jgi:hypothetical protein
MDMFWGSVFILGGFAFASVLASGSWWAVFPSFPLVAIGATILLPENSEAAFGAAILFEIVAGSF